MERCVLNINLIKSHQHGKRLSWTNKKTYFCVWKDDFLIRKLEELRRKSLNAVVSNAELFQLLTRAIQIDEAVAGWTLKKTEYFVLSS